MSRFTQRHHGIPRLVIQSLRHGQIVCCQVKRLLHVRKAQARTRIVGLGIQRQSLVDDVVGDGREKDAQVRRHVFGRVDAVPRLAVGLVLLVADNEGTAEVEAFLVELGFVCSERLADRQANREGEPTGVSNKVAVDARLELIGLVFLHLAGSAGQRGKVDLAHAVYMSALAAHGR